MANDGRLTDEQKRRAVDWLNKKGKDHICPVCQTNDWVVGDHLLAGLIHHGSGIVLGGVTYPQFFITCKNCAYTRHFMAVPVGLLGAAVPEEKKEAEAQAPAPATSGGGNG